MQPSRREFTKATTLLFATGFAGCPTETSDYTPPETSNTSAGTPDGPPAYSCLSPPQQSAPNPVFKEAYGEVVLNDEFTDNQYCIWRVFSGECFELSYEARVTGPDYGELDILVVPAGEGEKYLDKVRSDGDGIIDSAIDSATDKGTRISGFRESLTVKGLRSRYSPEGLRTKTAHLGPGEYYVIFDRTEIASQPTDEYVSAQIAIWARKLVDEEVEDQARDVLNAFYNSLADDTQETIQLADDLAEAICQTISLDYTRTTLKKIGDAPSKTYQATATVENLLDLLKAKTGFHSSLLYETTSTARTWTNRGATLVPILGGVLEVVDAACTVADQQAVPTVKQVEDFLLKLALLLIELVLARFGVTRKLSRRLISALDRYLLGYLKEVLSLEMYVFLLRELFLLLNDGLDIVRRIKDITDAIADLPEDFFSEDERRLINSMEREKDLFNLGIIDDGRSCP